MAPFRKPLTSFWSGDRRTVSLDGKSKSDTAISPFTWLVGTREKWRKLSPAAIAIGTQNGYTTAVLNPSPLDRIEATASG